MRVKSAYAQIGKRAPRGQAVVEYIVTFMVLAAGVLAVFLSFNPDALSIKSVFDQSVNQALVEIKR